MYTIPSPRYEGVTIHTEDGTDILSLTYCPPAHYNLCQVFGVTAHCVRVAPTRLVFGGVEVEIPQRNVRDVALLEMGIRERWEEARGPVVTLDLVSAVWVS